MIKKIAFDIDGTLTDAHFNFVAYFLKAYQRDFGKPYSGKIDHNAYLFQDIFPSVDKDYADKIAKEFMTVPDIYRKHVKELMNTLHNLGVEIHIITARGTDPIDGNDAEERTKESLKLGEIYYDELHVGFSDKYNVMKATGCELIVEDSSEQAINISEYFPVLLMDCPYNKKVSGMNIWRIEDEDLKPDIFVKKVKYVMNHLEGLYGDDYDFTGDNLFAFTKDAIIANPKNVKTSNIIFVLSAKEHPIGTDNLAKSIEKHIKKHTMLLDLNLLNTKEKDKSKRMNGDPLVIRAIQKYQKPKLDLSNTEDTQVYIAKTNAIKDLLKYADSHKDTVFIFNGIETFMLSRADLAKYENCPVFFGDCDKREISIARSKMHVKGYNAFLFMEDLTEVSTQLRKWRIIAGTAKNELSTYINRQWCDSDGVDRVSLLKGEKPFHPELVEAMVSMDTWVIGDLHLSEKDPEKTKTIIRNISKKVSKNDHLIILGDLDGKKGTGSFALTKKTISSLPTKNVYLILGNNDPYSIDDYVKIGFKSVVDMVTLKDGSRNIYLTHCPYPLPNGSDINIHGHIHGSRIYWNVDWLNHYDVWDQDYYPIQIRTCIDKIEKGLYQAKSENHKRY